MEGVIVNFRGSKKHKHNYQMIIKVDKVDSKEKAQSLVDKVVVWKTTS